MKWISKEGGLIEISSMSDLHLKNAIAYSSRINDTESIIALGFEYDKRQNQKAERPCPWCGHQMKMHNFEYEDPYPDVGFSLPDRWKQLVCSKCKAKGPEIR